MKGKKLFVCGGDKRSVYAAEYFREKGYDVCSFGLGGSEDLPRRIEADIVFLGLPAVRDGYLNMPLSGHKITFDELLERCLPGTTIAGGRFTAGEYSSARIGDFELKDYSEDEIFQLDNAVYTAEGALAALVSNTSASVCHMGILITGYGRISRALCNLMQSRLYNVTVYARSEVARAGCASMGFKVIDRLDDISGYDVVINTVPADIFTEGAIASAGKNVLIIDLSASPGYVNKTMCRDYGKRLLYLPGLPLSSAPQSAGISAAGAVERLTDG